MDKGYINKQLREFLSPSLSLSHTNTHTPSKKTTTLLKTLSISMVIIREKKLK